MFDLRAFYFREKRNLKMSPDNLIFKDVSFTYDVMSVPLLENINIHFSRGWTGIIGANGAGKTTVLKLAAGELLPGKGQITGSVNTIYCRQRTDAPPSGLNAFIESTDNDAFRLKGQLNIMDDWYKRWSSLSHGERKRAQIAAALWQRPQVLAVDEPTNHLDSEAREYLFDALKSFRGTGLLVSHDRELLDGLCRQCVFIEPPGAVMRPGNFSEGLQAGNQEKDALINHHKTKKQAYLKIKKETAKRRSLSGQADRIRSKRGLGIKDHDARSKKDMARVTNKDATAGKLLNQLNGRLKQAKEELDSLAVIKKYETGIWVTGAKSKRKFLFNVKQGVIDFGERGRLLYPDLIMCPDDRIALTGVNGAGKSTLLSRIVSSISMDNEKLVYIPQEINRDASKRIIKNAKRFSGDKLGKMMAVVSRLGSRPERLLESDEPSPGETRKLMLAAGIANEPHLIIMDEPTNHMDLPSIQCLEDALNDCPCGLLLVSHDRIFLEHLTSKSWHIKRKGNDGRQFVLNVS